MDGKILRLLARIDIIFGGTGSREKILSDIRKIESRKVFSKPAIWQRTYDCSEFERIRDHKHLNKAIEEIKKIAEPETVCRICKLFNDRVLDDLALFFFIFDLPTKKFEKVFPASETMFGYPARRLHGMTEKEMRKYIRRDHVMDIVHHLHHLDRTDEISSVEYDVITSQNEWVTLKNTSIPLAWNRDGTLRKTFGYVSKAPEKVYA